MSNKQKLSLEEINSDAFIQKLKKGDEQAFSDLFSCIVPKLCSYFSNYFQLSNEDGVEEAANTMLKVNKSITEFNPEGGAKLSTWIFRIAKNTAIDLKRQKKKQAENDRVDAPLDDTANRQIEQKMVKQWFRDNDVGVDGDFHKGISLQLTKIDKALDNLNEQDKNLLLMRQSMEYEEISEVENLSVPTLRTRYSRALERLRNELEKD